MAHHLSILTAILVFMLPLQLNATSAARDRSQSVGPAWGGWDVYVQTGDQWQRAGRLAYRAEMQKQSLDLQPFIIDSGSPVHLRLVQTDGGEAHIDAIDLGGHPAVSIQGENLELGDVQRLASVDRDLLTATRKTLELIFPTASGSLLSLTARVEFQTIASQAFRFPAQEQSYLSYTVNTTVQSRQIDGQLDETSGTPFLRQWTIPKSGHPAANTLAWVSNDKDNLYVAVDFLPDNTPDPGKDFAAVRIRTSSGEKRFAINGAESAWGSGAFTYTAQATYRHKAYEFKIPLGELDGTDSISLALETYGTASPGYYEPSVAWDSKRNRYLVVFSELDGGCDVYVGSYFVSPSGVSSGTTTRLESQIGACGPTDTKVLYNVVADQYLVVFSEMYGAGVAAYRLDAMGGKLGTKIVVSDSGYGPYSIDATLDPSSNRYLVVWDSYYATGWPEVLGQLVSADGTLYGTASSTNIVFTTGHNAYVQNPRVAANTIEGGFMVIWQDSGGGAYAVRVFADGSTGGTLIPISLATLSFSRQGLAFDNTRNRYLAAWTDYRNASNFDDIYGQFLDATGAPSGTTIGANFGIALTDSSQNDPIISYNSLLDQYLAVWTDGRSGSQFSWGQLLSGTGTIVGSEFALATTEANYWPDAAANSACGNWLIAAEKSPVSTALLLETVGSACTPALLTWQDSSGTPGDNRLDFITPIRGLTGGSIQLRNSGATALEIVAINTTGSAFAVAQDSCTGQFLLLGSTCLIQVTHSPDGIDNSSGAIQVFTTAGGVTFNLYGVTVWKGIDFTNAAGLPIRNLALDSAPASGTAATAMFIRNISGAVIPIGSYTISGTNGIRATGECVGDLTAGGSCPLALTLRGDAGLKKGKLEVRNSDAELLAWLPVTGMVLPLGIEVSPQYLLMESAVSSVTSITVTLINRGDKPVALGTAEWLLAESSLSVTDDTCSSSSLADSTQCTVGIQFAPTATGAISSALQFSLNDPSQFPPTIYVSGKAIDNTTPPAPILIAPNDGASEVPLTVTMAFHSVQDADGDALTYQLFLCENKTFSGCAGRVVPATKKIASIHPGSHFMLAPWMFTMAGLIAFRRRRVLVVIMLALAFALPACTSAKDYGPPFIASDAQTLEVSGLKADTEYYWMVMVADGVHKVNSEIWQFHTITE